MPKVFLCEEDRAYNEFLEWLLGKREVNRMTDTYLSKERGISQSAMSKKFRNETPFTLKEFFYFARLFEMDSVTFNRIIRR